MKHRLLICVVLMCVLFAAAVLAETQEEAGSTPAIKVTQIAQLATPEPSNEPEAPQGEVELEEAFIFTPNTGKASLRAKPYEKGKLIKQCKGGTIVEVLEYGKQWTKIKDGKREGYIRTDCLKFLDAARQPIATADLSWRGTTTGGTRINIRNAPDMESHVIGQWRTGTDVMIFSHQDGWYEVEAFNMHGFVAEEYVTVKGE